MKKIFAFFAMLLLLVSSVSALKTFVINTDDRTIESRFEMYSTDPRYGGAGFAFLRSTRARGASISTILVRINGLIIPDDKVLEVWVVDEDTRTAFSLGQLITSRTGQGVFVATYRGYLHEFDTAIVTLEQFPDPNPAQGIALLSGSIIEGITLIRARASVYGRTIGRTSERAYTGYQSQVATQLPYRRSYSIVPY